MATPGGSEWRANRGAIGLLVLALAGGACDGGASQTSPHGDAGAGDAPTAVDAGCPYPCFKVYVGGDAGSLLPDPGVIFVQSDVRSVVADPHRNVVYGSVRLGGVQAISTETGARLWDAASLGLFDPNRLVVTDDGSKLYASDSASSGGLERIDVASRTADLYIRLPVNLAGDRPFDAFDLATVPGAPRSVVVSTTDCEGTTLVLDDDVARPDRGTPGLQPFLWMDGPSTVYALFWEGIATLTLSATGIGSGATGPVPNLFERGRSEFLFDGELAFSDDGHVVDPAAGVLLGMYGPGSVAVDRSGGRAYVLPRPSPNLADDRIVVVEYDRTRFTALRKLTLSLRAPQTRIVRAADGTLALWATVAVNPGYPGILLIRPDAWNAAVAP